MIAQSKAIYGIVDLSNDATVQAAEALLKKQPLLRSYRWICVTCGMIHAGSPPSSCDSCGGSLERAHPDAIRREMSARL